MEGTIEMRKYLISILVAILLFIRAADVAEATPFVELESNNTFATGQVLGSSDGTIEIAGSRVGDASADFYRFFAAAGDVITAVTNSPTGTCFTQDPMHGLFNPAGSYVTSDDDSGSGCNSSIASFHITTTGLWGLAVVGWEDLGFDGGGNSGWTYTTNITGLTPETARIPEPSTLVLLGAGLLALSYYARRQWRTTSSWSSGVFISWPVGSWWYQRHFNDKYAGSDENGQLRSHPRSFATNRHMSVRYRKHLILPTISQDEVTGTWTATAHIQFTEKLAFTNFILRSSAIFRTKKEAEKHIVEQAKKWIDERLRSHRNK
jgi:hypothetical protein